ncbi:MAG: DoxX family protein [Deltaproteobacteria bacterium]|nr:DoxX family protein [Deltaproteobacteria bacterium]MBW2220762.1 DoxX family protein [Deltaproteobacteria bacterium]
MFCGIASTNRLFFTIWPYRAVRFIIAGIFLWFGIAKLLNPQSFVVIIDAYGLIPENLLMPVAVCLPALEVIAAIGLIMDARGSLAIIAALLALFMAILGYGLWMGLDIDCGCFGPEDHEGRAYQGLRPTLYRDVVMMAGVFYLYFWRYHQSVSPVRLRALLNNQSGEES